MTEGLLLLPWPRFHRYKNLVLCSWHFNLKGLRGTSKFAKSRKLENWLKSILNIHNVTTFLHNLLIPGMISNLTDFGPLNTRWPLQDLHKFWRHTIKTMQHNQSKEKYWDSIISYWKTMRTVKHMVQWQSNLQNYKIQKGVNWINSCFKTKVSNLLDIFKYFITHHPRNTHSF